MPAFNSKIHTDPHRTVALGEKSYMDYTDEEWQALRNKCPSDWVLKGFAHRVRVSVGDNIKNKEYFWCALKCVAVAVCSPFVGLAALLFMIAEYVVHDKKDDIAHEQRFNVLVRNRERVTPDNDAL